MTKVLVIDDDELSRSMLCSTLRKSGFNVSEACNGVEGLRLMRECAPDVVLTDILMPEKGGIETIAEITSLYDKTKIIAMSSGGIAKNMSFLQLAKNAGAAHICEKPFKPAEIVAAINTLALGLSAGGMP